jgi:hypothetical protein
MYDLYDINFQFDNKSFEIHIRYNIINDWFTMNHFKKIYIRICLIKHISHVHHI